jgi:simple sugar transport system permease protein
MTAVTTAPPTGSGVRAVARAGLTRRQIVGLIFGVLGVLLLALVVPNLSNDKKAFAFEAPPDPLQWTFRPPTLVAVIGVLYVLVAVAAWLPRRLERVGFWAQVVGVVLVIPLVLAIALALSETSGTNVTNLLALSLVLSTPYALGAMTGLWCEHSGIVNIGIEGQMLASAGVGFMVYTLLGDATDMGIIWIGILASVVTGALLGALHAWLTVTFLVNQIISGVVINLFALGLTGFLRSEVIVKQGVTTGKPLSPVGIPLLDRIPIVGHEFFKNKPIFFLMIVIVALTGVVMYRTPWGLRARSSGENPHAAETLGVNVIAVRYQAVILGGAIAGLAGAWFSMEAQGGFEDNMTNGAGFIALAAMIFGKWRPWGAFAGAVLFGFTRALGARLQILNVEIGGFAVPSTFWQMLPYVITLVVVAGAVGRAIPPAAEGIPYERSR